MVSKMLVIDDRPDVRKDGSRHRILTLADTQRPALTHTVAYEPKGDDLTKLPPEGKAVDLELEIAIRAFRWNNFQLCMEANGSILQVFSPNGGPKPVGK